MNVIISAILLGISLCADCFAVALCSSVTVTREEVRRKVWTIAAVFAVIQTGLFLVGWGLGMGATELISEHVAHFEKFAHALGFLLLLYVGGAMFLDGVRSKSEHLNLGGFKSIVIGGIATSLYRRGRRGSVHVHGRGSLERNLAYIDLHLRFHGPVGPRRHALRQFHRPEARVLRPDRRRPRPHRPGREHSAIVKKFKKVLAF